MVLACRSTGCRQFDMRSPLNIEARYSLRKSRLMESLTVECREKMIQETETLFFPKVMSSQDSYRKDSAERKMSFLFKIALFRGMTLTFFLWE